MKKMLMLFALLSSLVFASNYKYEITPTVGGVWPEGNLDLNDQFTYGLRLGINVDSIFDQVEFGIDRSDNVDYDNSARSAVVTPSTPSLVYPDARASSLANSKKSTDITRYFVNLIKFYPLRDKLSLYSLIGLGYENLSTDYAGNEDDGFFNYGLGLKYMVSDNFSLRAEVRHAIKFDHGGNNLFYTVGFAIPFGKKAEPMPAPAPKPVVIGDDDNDGVNNNMDLCPNTPAGVKVDAKGCELDSDNDGVVDSKDLCPNTPAGVKVDAKGCELDSDHDGVLDSQDLCPNTPMGNVVNSDGCVKVIHLHVTFATNKADISENYMSQIKKVAKFMGINKDYRVILEGNTDARGSEKYNLKLSLKRANAVSNALQAQGVEASRITAKGLGELNPIASNKTKEGRAENRRVDASFMK